ncbi:hypothetical protein D3C73_1006620 [compost metagenome]
MHDHHRRQVVDPEVLILVITQTAHGAQCLLLCRFAGEGAGGLQAVVIGQNAAGCLHHVLGFLCLGVIEIVVDLLEHQHTQRQEHHDGYDQDEPQTAADRHTAQAVHSTVTPVLLFFYSAESHHTLSIGHIRPKSNNVAALFGLV